MYVRLIAYSKNDKCRYYIRISEIRANTIIITPHIGDEPKIRLNGIKFNYKIPYTKSIVLYNINYIHIYLYIC